MRPFTRRGAEYDGNGGHVRRTAQPVFLCSICSPRWCSRYGYLAQRGRGSLAFTRLVGGGHSPGGFLQGQSLFWIGNGDCSVPYAAAVRVRLVPDPKPRWEDEQIDTGSTMPVSAWPCCACFAYFFLFVLERPEYLEARGAGTPMECVVYHLVRRVGRSVRTLLVTAHAPDGRNPRAQAAGSATQCHRVKKEGETKPRTRRAPTSSRAPDPRVRTHRNRCRRLQCRRYRRRLATCSRMGRPAKLPLVLADFLFRLLVLAERGGAIRVAICGRGFAASQCCWSPGAAMLAVVSCHATRRVRTRHGRRPKARHV